MEEVLLPTETPTATAAAYAMRATAATAATSARTTAAPTRTTAASRSTTAAATASTGEAATANIQTGSQLDQEVQQLITQLQGMLSRLEQLQIKNVTAEAADRLKYSRMTVQKIVQKFISFNFTRGFLPSAEYRQPLADFHILLAGLRNEVVMLETNVQHSQREITGVDKEIAMLQGMRTELTEFLNYSRALDHHQRLQMMGLKIKQQIEWLRTFSQSIRLTYRQKNSLATAVQQLEIFKLQSDLDISQVVILLDNLEHDLVATNSEPAVAQLSDELAAILKQLLVLEQLMTKILEEQNYKTSAATAFWSPPLPTVAPASSNGVGK